MPKLIAEGADIRWRSRTIFNALSRLRQGFGEPGTTRSTLRLAHLFVNTFDFENEFIRSRFTKQV